MHRSADISDETLERVGDLVGRLAGLTGRTNTEVARAVLASKALGRAGYSDAQRGHLDEHQGQVAARLLERWIDQHEQRQH